MLKNNLGSFSIAKQKKNKFKNEKKKSNFKFPKQNYQSFVQYNGGRVVSKRLLVIELVYYYSQNEKKLIKLFYEIFKIFDNFFLIQTV